MVIGRGFSELALSVNVIVVLPDAVPMKFSEATSTTASLSVSPDRTIDIVICPVFSSTEYTALEKLTVATRIKRESTHALLVVH